jgi:hypothetical protein
MLITIFAKSRGHAPADPLAAPAVCAFAHGSFAVRITHSPGATGGNSVVTKQIAPMQQIARQHPLHPLMIVIGVLILAGTAKLGHAMCGIGGLFAFYPTYLAIVVAGRNAASLLSRVAILPPLVRQRAYATISFRTAR